MRQDLESVFGGSGDGSSGGPAAEVSSEHRQATMAAVRESLRDAEEAAERVRAIVRDLRVFSRAEEDLRGPVDVQKILESSLRMARNELRGRATVAVDFGAVPNVEGNEGRLGQVFLNLLVNAAHAIPEGQAEQNTITVRTRFENDAVLIEVADTGTGITPEVLPSIFDAFFTTKPIGIGTGLGLAICHRIVTALNGRIEVKSELGVGSTFRVFLPKIRGRETRKIPILQRAMDPGASRRGSVLVVEDEPALCRVLERLLAAHEVTAVTRAREGLKKIRAGGQFSVVLCDLMMPEMTGMEFYEELRRERNDLASRVVFMSGGALTAHAREFLDRVPNLRLDKPIDTIRLHRLVNEAVGVA
jgi:CheY-like chemotaxis protein/two-component sensor histidine kinase